MKPRFVIVGTDTGVGKSVFSAALVGALDGCYWKPVQAGLEGETDSEIVARLSGVGASRIYPEAWRLRAPASPHHAAALDGAQIDPDALTPPECAGPLVIETAGGVMTPLTADTPTIDVLARWALPVIVVARTALGTINHCLLTIEALRRRDIPLAGVAFVGDDDRPARAAVSGLGKVVDLGRLPRVDPLTATNLRYVFSQSFDPGGLLKDVSTCRS